MIEIDDVVYMHGARCVTNASAPLVTVKSVSSGIVATHVAICNERFFLPMTYKR